MVIFSPQLIFVLSGDRSSNSCIGWRQTKGCNPDGTREFHNDKNCFVEIKDRWSGYCDCKDGSKKKKRCNQRCRENCDKACETGYLDCGKNLLLDILLKQL